MNWPRELIGAAAVLGAGVVIIVLLEWWVRRARPPAEVARKLLHLAGVVPCLFVPILVHSVAVAVVAALTLAIGLWAGVRSGLLRSVAGVARHSHGAVYYPFAILGAFILAGDRTWMFLSALLAFGVADAFAALIGSAYGRRRYQVEDEEKSLEGSLVFFAITFAAVALPLWLMAGVAWPNCLLAAFLTAVLATGLEAVSLRGTDNLSVPLGVCLVLERIALLPWQALLEQSLVLLGVVFGVGMVVRLSRQISPAAAIVFILFFDAVSLFADWRWALAAASGFVLYAGARMAVAAPPGNRPQVKIVLLVCVLIPPLLIVALAAAAGLHGFLEGPYLACSATVVCFGLRVCVGRCGAVPRRLHPVLAALAGAAIGTWLAAVPWWLQQAPIQGLVAVAATCALLMVVHEFTVPRDAGIAVDDFWTAPRFLLTCAAPLIIAGLQCWQLIQPWSALVQLDELFSTYSLLPV